MLKNRIKSILVLLPMLLPMFAMGGCSKKADSKCEPEASIQEAHPNGHNEFLGERFELVDMPISKVQQYERYFVVFDENVYAMYRKGIKDTDKVPTDGEELVVKVVRLIPQN